MDVLHKQEGIKAGGMEPLDNETLPERFDRVVHLHGRRTALGTGSWQPTYRELGEAANRLANYMIDRGGRPGDRVAILMRHDSPLIAAMLAVLKAGRIVVALNTSDPLPRLRAIVENAGAAQILTDDANVRLAQQVAGDLREVLTYEGVPASMSTKNPLGTIGPDDTAFLTYTSGTTGQPKAVIQTHNYTINNAVRHCRIMEFVPQDRLTFFASLSGTQGVSTAWSALAHGAALCPFPVIEKGVIGLADWINDQNITVYRSSASLYRHFMSTLDVSVRFPQMRVVRVASELATSEDFKAFQRHFSDRCAFVHSLSSSETGNISQLRLFRRDSVPEGRLSIGTISEGVEVSLLDEDGREVPHGGRGEIVVRSRFLAAGYWGNDALTAEKFSEGPPGSGLRQFRTGDVGRFRPDGMLEHLGRKDDRLKIRGFRIEPSEVENALSQVPGVETAVVIAIAPPDKAPHLVAFIVLAAVRSGQTRSQPDLRRAMRAVLPDHMVPSEFVILEEFPITPTGKIDRETLRRDHRPRRRQQSGVQPKTETETLLAAIWAEVFELTEISQQDNFFELGGDSLTAAVVGARIYDAFKVELNLAMFANHPTLEKLAQVIDRLRAAGASDEPPLEPAPRTEPPPMSFTQARTWKHSQSPAASAAHTMARIYRISGPLDPGILRDCMDYLLRRHELLRTTYVEHDGNPVQLVDPSISSSPLRYLDLRSEDDPEAHANAIIAKEADCAFDLSSGPLFRFLLARLHDKEHWLLRVSHHIIADNVSWLLYFEELAQLYEAKSRGEPPSLPDSATLQYADYAVWERKLLRRDGVAYGTAVSWWKQNLSGAQSAFRFSFTREKSASDVTPADGMLSWGIDRQVSHRLNVLSVAQDATPTMVRLAVFAALLASEVRASDVSIGMYASGRTRLSLRKVFGDFTNLLILRFRFDASKSFEEWLSIVRDQVLRAEANGTIPYEKLCDELRASGIRPPDIQIIFHPALSRRPIEFAELSLSALNRARQSFPWGFTVDFDVQNEDSGCQMLFDPRIYDPAGVRLLVERYKRLLAAVSHHPDKTLETLLAMSSPDVVAPPGTMPALVFQADRPDEQQTLRLSGHVVRHFQSWRKLHGLVDRIVMKVLGTTFSSPARFLRRSQTIALKPEPCQDYCNRTKPERFASREVLLHEPIHTSRIWACVAPKADIVHSRIITIDDFSEPTFGSAAAPAYRPTQQTYLRVPSATVYPRPGLVMVERGVVLRNNLLRWVPPHRLMPGFVGFAEGNLVARENELRPRRRVRRPMLMLCHAFHPNYGHWMFDCLPYLLPWREPIRQGRMAVLAPPLAIWQRRTLEILGVPASAVVEAREPSILCHGLIIPGLHATNVEETTETSNFNLSQPASSVVETIKFLKAGIRPTAVSDRPERIYISRRGIESFRIMRNESEVETTMMRLGFVIVRPQELPFDEQVATFAGARIIVGPHGAGLTNAAFAPAGCLVVDICAYSWVSRWTSRLTQLFEHQHVHVTFPSDDAFSHPKFLDGAELGEPYYYTVQTDMLARVVTEVMRRHGMERGGPENVPA